MLHILYRDDHLVAIAKPAGLLVHRTGIDAGETRFALQLLRDQLGRQVWPVHRLDKGTSGVLLFALDAQAACLLGHAFENAQLTKRYLALVRGWPASEQGLIEHPLARDPEQPSAGQTLLSARTAWQVRQRLTWPIQTDPRFPSSRFGLLELEPQTGRRHQIRRHLKHISHPVIGDATHGKGPVNRAVAAHLGVQRLWLHAFELVLRHPLSGATLILQAEPGPEWSLLDHPDRQA